MAIGKIKSLVRDRGFGFIQKDGSSDDIFFHRTAVSSGNFDDMKEGETVEFDVESDTRDPRRSRAGNVRAMG
jgi:CspA family cold shock protein